MTQHDQHVRRAVHHLHHEASKNEIVHQDIKPANILVDTLHGKRIIKLTDFGIASARRVQSNYIRPDLEFVPAWCDYDTASSRTARLADAFAVGMVGVKLARLDASTANDRNPDRLAQQLAEVQTRYGARFAQLLARCTCCADEAQQLDVRAMFTWLGDLVTGRTAAHIHSHYCYRTNSAQRKHSLLPHTIAHMHIPAHQRTQAHQQQAH